MSTVEEMQDNFERFLNEQRADISIVQVTLQCFILDVLQVSPDPVAVLAQLRASSQASLERMLSGGHSLPPFAQERFAQFFAAMEAAVLSFQTKVAPSKEKH